MLFSSQSHRQTSCIMDILIYTFLCLICSSTALRLPADKKQTVKLVPNAFQIIVQSSLVTSPPKTSKQSSSSEQGQGYQADQGYYLPWPVKEALPKENNLIPRTPPCKKLCPYGLEADVEGNELCKCKDPCKGVQCFGGSKCEPKRQCILDRCSFTAVCKASKADDVCSLPKPKYTFTCEKLSKRYYYDAKKGFCRKFWGCAEISGNSFSNKKECKSACYTKEHKQRDRKARKHRKNSKESWSSRVSSELAENEISNKVPTYKRLPSINNQLTEDFEEKNNQVEAHPQQSPYSPIFTHHVPGLNQLTGCPEDSPYQACPYDPCSGCKSSNIMCFTSFCGKCQAIYIDLRTGEASDKFASVC